MHTHSVFNLLRWNENFLFQNCNIFLVLRIFKYNSKGKTNNKFINNFYSEILQLRVQKESDELLYTVWLLVMVREPVTSARS